VAFFRKLMRFVERQARLEKRTYEAIDELEDVFDVEIPFYPEVRWLGRRGCFEDLGLPEYYRDDIEDLQRCGRSVFVNRANVIVLNDVEPTHINEEASHYVHFRVSNIQKIKRKQCDWLLTSSIIEMFGFLGSKFLNFSRRNDFQGRPDYFQMAFEKRVSYEDALSKLNALSEQFEEEFIYTQGYGLGERVFCALQADQLSMDYIKDLFKKNFFGRGEVANAFKELRAQVWPVN
jgi:hypothetical protein